MRIQLSIAETSCHPGLVSCSNKLQSGPQVGPALLGVIRLVIFTNMFAMATSDLFSMACAAPFEFGLNG